jgi:Sucrase/ferredoxin-like
MRCADAADAAGDPREGTAPPAEQWFLLEHAGPWGRIAYTQSGLDAADAHALAAWARRTRGRVLLVRRPGRAPRSDAPRRWFRIDSRRGREEIRAGHAPGPLTPDAPGERFDGPLHLVCTHGRHDTCCAVRGRPLAAVLNATHPGHVWECSHVGGCRFAAALVLLPHGFTLAGLPPDAAPAVIDAYANGRLDPQWVRGRSVDPPVVQAAQHHARTALGALGVDALRPVSVTTTTRGQQVVLADPDVTVLLHERHTATDRPLTCASTEPGWMRTFDLVALHTTATSRPEDRDLPTIR